MTWKCDEFTNAMAMQRIRRYWRECGFPAIQLWEVEEFSYTRDGKLIAVMGIRSNIADLRRTK